MKSAAKWKKTKTRRASITRHTLRTRRKMETPDYHGDDQMGDSAQGNYSRKRSSQ